MNKKLYNQLATAKRDIKNSKDMETTQHRIEKLITSLNRNTECYTFITNSFVRLGEIYDKHIKEHHNIANADPQIDIQHLTNKEHQIFQENASNVIDIAINRYCEIEWGN